MPAPIHPGFNQPSLCFLGVAASVCLFVKVGTGPDSPSLQVRPMPASCEPPAATQPSRFKSLRDLRQVPSCKRVLGHDQSGYQRLRGRGFALASLRQARHLIVSYLAAAPASFAPLPLSRCLLCVVCWRAARLSHLAFERNPSNVYLCVLYFVFCVQARCSSMGSWTTPGRSCEN